MCPTINGAPTFTGCVATTMAQIMKYWNYPASGSGKSVAYTTSGIDLPSVSFEVDYNWENMQNTYAGDETPQQQNAVATLMYHCGLSVQTEYNFIESAAFNQNAYYALIHNFGYDDNMQISYRLAYNDAEWDAMLRDQIDKGLPVYYAGQDTSINIGHAFICDGYDSDGKFHFNWGWSGFYDGYFVTFALNPNSYNFSSEQFVITDIKPAQGGLKELNVSSGTLSPAFRSYIFDYTLHVDSSVETIDIIGITDILGSAVTGNVTGLQLKSNDHNDVTITVTDKNGNIQCYKIDVIRGSLLPVSFVWEAGTEEQKDILLKISALKDSLCIINWGDNSKCDSIIGIGYMGPMDGIPAMHQYDAFGAYQVTINYGDKLNCPLLSLYFDNCDLNLRPNNVTSIDIKSATNLMDLFCGFNDNLTELDVSRNVNLQILVANENNIRFLDVSNNKKLDNIEIDNNQLTSLDVNQNTMLRYLTCNDNHLTTIDVRKNRLLLDLTAYENPISDLDVSANSALEILQFGMTDIATIDLTHNPNLQTITFPSSKLTSIDLSHNPQLWQIGCAYGELTNLDVSNNPNLKHLICNDNKLTTLDISNNPLLASENYAL